MSEHSDHYHDADRNKPLPGATVSSKEEVLQTLLDAARGEITALTEANKLLAAQVATKEDEIVALHRRLAAETLRANQGWERYESANKDRNDIRAAQVAKLQHTSSIDEDALEDAAWEFSEYAPKGGIPPVLWNNLKAALRPAIQLYLRKTSVIAPVAASVGDDPNFLLSTMDAKIWADEFIKRNNSADHGMMLSWFACAIMTGFDEATRRTAKVAEGAADAPSEPTEILAKVMTRDDFNCSTELGYAQFIAWAIWLKSYRTASPEFTIMSDLMGVLSQIDNMACGLSRAADALDSQPTEPVRNNVPGSPHNVCRTTEHNLRKRIEELEARIASSQPTDGEVRNEPL